MSTATSAAASGPIDAAIRKITTSVSLSETHFANSSQLQPKQHYYGSYSTSVRPKFAPLLLNLAPLDSISGMGFGIFLAAAELPSSLSTAKGLRRSDSKRRDGREEPSERQDGPELLRPQEPYAPHDATSKRAASTDHRGLKEIARTGRAVEASKDGAR